VSLCTRCGVCPPLFVKNLVVWPKLIDRATARVERHQLTLARLFPDRSGAIDRVTVPSCLVCKEG
jgi:hypothetical protein